MGSGCRVTSLFLLVLALILTLLLNLPRAMPTEHRAQCPEVAPFTIPPPLFTLKY